MYILVVLPKNRFRRIAGEKGYIYFLPSTDTFVLGWCDPSIGALGRTQTIHNDEQLRRQVGHPVLHMVEWQDFHGSVAYAL